MTGIFVRIRRNDRWQNIEIEHLSDNELNSFAKEHPDVGWTWAKHLIRWIRNNMQEKETERSQQ